MFYKNEIIDVENKTITRVDFSDTSGPTVQPTKITYNYRNPAPCIANQKG